MFRLAIWEGDDVRYEYYDNETDAFCELQALDYIGYEVEMEDISDWVCELVLCEEETLCEAL